jgi:catechol 2,3-dioxygenase-like lactoylglutathione lyase family enzyme
LTTSQPRLSSSGRQPARTGEHAGYPPRRIRRRDIDAIVAGLRARGAKLVGELENYEDIYRLCYVRGPEGIIIELAEQIG